MSNCFECEYHKVDTYYGDILCRHVDNLGSINCPGAPRDCEFFKPLDIEEKIKDLESFERETRDKRILLSHEIDQIIAKRQLLLDRSVKIGREIERLQKIQKEYTPPARPHPDGWYILNLPGLGWRIREKRENRAIARGSASYSDWNKSYVIARLPEIIWHDPRPEEPEK